MNEEDIKDRVGQVESKLTDIFGARLDDLAEIDKRRITITNLIDDSKRFSAMDNDLALILLIEELINYSKGNSRLFLTGLRSRKGWLETHMGSLSDFIKSQLERTNTEFGSADALNILRSLYAITINKNSSRETVISFLKTHSVELETALSKIRNRRIAERIRYALLRITNQEANYMTRYLGEVESWKSSEAVKRDIKFFISKIQLFLYGRADGYLGLIAYFKDEQFEKTILRSPRFLQLSRYSLQLVYLRKLRGKIISFESGNWEQFNDFYANIRKIAANFEQHFGNAEIAAELMSEKESIGEYPQKWLEYFDRKIAEYSSTTYVRAKVIFPFAVEIEKIFYTRLNELESTEKPEISELSGQLEALLMAHARLEKNIERVILRELKYRKKKLMKRIRVLRNRFNSLVDACVDSLFAFSKAKTELIDETIKPGILLRLKIAEAYVQNEGIFIRHAQTIIGGGLEQAPLDFSRFVALLYDFDKADRSSVGAASNILDISRFVTHRGIIRRIEYLNKLLENTEKAYNELNNFINAELGFLENALELQMKGESYGR